MGSSRTTSSHVTLIPPEAHPLTSMSQDRQIRSAKSGSDWTVGDLDSYNIKVKTLSARAFYGRDLPATVDGVDQTVVRGNVGSPGLTVPTKKLLRYLDLATKANAGQESAIDDFTRELLRTLGYEEDELILRTRYAIPFHICDERSRSAQTDICLVDGNSTILLVIQEDKTVFSGTDPEPQVIAEAIAAFQLNNRNRNQLGLPRLELMSIPCITLVGTRPIFYVVPVTKALSAAVEMGQWPEDVTEVKKCVVGDNRRLSEGMEQPDFREVALKHYVLFRPLAKELWSKFLIYTAPP